MQASIVRLLLIPLLLSGSLTAQSDNAQLRQTMHQAFDALAYLLPLSLRDDATINSTDQELIERYLNVLTSSKQVLAEHAEARDPEFRLLTRSLDRAIARVSYSFRGENHIDAYFALSDMTQNCVSCHARLPDESDFLLGQKLFTRMDREALGHDEIAQLYIATRQFDYALSKLEEMILGDSFNPFDLDLDGVLIEYLHVGLTVTRETARVRATLTDFLDREDVPLYLRQHVQVWNKSIDQLTSDLTVEPTLERARDIFQQATDLTLTPGGRERAVHDIIAAGMLRRWLELGGGTPEQISEAYFLLGVVALRTLQPQRAVPEMEFMLESSIRAAPKSPFARNAYLILEEFSYSNYPSLGTPQIFDPEIDIRELRALIE